MKTKGRYIVGMAVGFSAGLLGWSLLELVLSLQHLFPGYRYILLASGALTGASLSAVLASMEGILHKNITKIHKEWLLGLVWGAIGGTIGAFAGQLLFNWILPEGLMPESFRYPYYIARIISWGLMGAFIGTAEGLRARSGTKITAGLISGISAGVVGGTLVETGMLLFPGDSWLKLPGFLIIGMGTALLNILIEEKNSAGVFRMLNGSEKGRKYLLNQKKISLGSSRHNDIIIKGDPGLPATVAVLRRRRREVFIENRDREAPLSVNDRTVDQTALKYEDVIQVGKIKFLYEVR